MRYLLFDDQNRTNLLPLAYTRPVAEFRVGILTIKEKWAKRMPSNATFSGFVTEEYLQAKFPASIQEDQIWINASICPNDSLVKKITSLNCNQSLYDHSNNMIAFRTDSFENSADCKKITTEISFTHILNVWDIFSKNIDYNTRKYKGIDRFFWHEEIEWRSFNDGIYNTIALQKYI